MSVQNCGWNLTSADINPTTLMTVTGTQTVTGVKTITQVQGAAAPASGSSMLSLQCLTHPVYEFAGQIVTVPGDGALFALPTETLPFEGNWIWTANISFTSKDVGSLTMLGDETGETKWPAGQPINATFTGCIRATTADYSFTPVLIGYSISGADFQVAVNDWYAVYETFVTAIK